MTGAMFSHPAGADPDPDPAAPPTLEELRERERRRRAALAAARERGELAPLRRPVQVGVPVGGIPVTSADRPSSSDPRESVALPAELPTGFTSTESWRAALAAVEAVAAYCHAEGYPASALQGEREGMSADVLARAVASTMRTLPPVKAVDLLRQVHGSGLCLLTPRLTVRAEALLDKKPNRISDMDDSDAAPSVLAAEEAWWLYRDAERVEYSKIPAEREHALAVALPLPVVDDLIDRRRLVHRPLPGTGQRALYIRSRLAPTDLDQEDLEELGWEGELARRQFRSRLAVGDSSVLQEDLHGLPPTDRELAVALTKARQSGQIPPALQDQKWLWGALEKLVPQAAVNVRRDRTFGPWLLVRRLQRAVRMAHRALLYGDSKKHQALMRTALNEASVLATAWSDAGWEALNILAYVQAVGGPDGPRYTDALDTLMPQPGKGPREDRLAGGARRRLDENRNILRALIRRPDSSHLLNPYLVLGIPDDAEDWKDHWRQLRRSLNDDGEAQVNEAKDAIERFQRGRSEIPPFSVPLAPEKWALPGADESVIRRGGAPMPRQTPQPDADEQEFARAEAARGIVCNACHNVGLPAEPEAPEHFVPESSPSDQ